MATLPKFEVPSGAINGVNVVFVVSAPYQPGSVAVFLNGQLKRRDFLDGWTETNPATGTVTLAEPPLAGDVVQIFFIDVMSGVEETEELCPLKGTITEEDALTGRFRPEDELTGTIICGE